MQNLKLLIGNKKTMLAAGIITAAIIATLAALMLNGNMLKGQLDFGGSVPDLVVDNSQIDLSGDNNLTIGFALPNDPNNPDASFLTATIQLVNQAEPNKQLHVFNVINENGSVFMQSDSTISINKLNDQNYSFVYGLPSQYLDNSPLIPGGHTLIMSFSTKVAPIIPGPSTTINIQNTVKSQPKLENFSFGGPTSFDLADNNGQSLSFKVDLTGAVNDGKDYVIGVYIEDSNGDCCSGWTKTFAESGTYDTKPTGDVNLGTAKEYFKVAGTFKVRAKLYRPPENTPILVIEGPDLVVTDSGSNSIIKCPSINFVDPVTNGIPNFTLADSIEGSTADVIVNGLNDDCTSSFVNSLMIKSNNLTLKGEEIIDLQNPSSEGKFLRLYKAGTKYKLFFDLKNKALMGGTAYTLSAEAASMIFNVDNCANFSQIEFDPNSLVLDAGDSVIPTMTMATFYNGNQLQDNGKLCWNDFKVALHFSLLDQNDVVVAKDAEIFEFGNNDKFIAFEGKSKNIYLNLNLSKLTLASGKYNLKAYKQDKAVGDLQLTVKQKSTAAGSGSTPTGSESTATGSGSTPTGSGSAGATGSGSAGAGSGATATGSGSAGATGSGSAGAGSESTATGGSKATPTPTPTPLPDPHPAPANPSFPYGNYDGGLYGIKYPNVDPTAKSQIKITPTQPAASHQAATKPIIKSNSNCGGYTDTQNLPKAECDLAKKMKENGIFTSNQFRANDPVMRYESALMLVRAFKIDTKCNPGVLNIFKDVDLKAAYFDQLCAAVTAKIIKGYMADLQNPTLMPSKNVTLRELSRMMTNIYIYTGRDIGPTGYAQAATELGFAQNRKNDWFGFALQFMLNRGLSNPQELREIPLDKPLNRLEVAEMISRVLEDLAKNSSPVISKNSNLESCNPNVLPSVTDLHINPTPFDLMGGKGSAVVSFKVLNRCSNEVNVYIDNVNKDNSISSGWADYWKNMYISGDNFSFNWDGRSTKSENLVPPGKYILYVKIFNKSGVIAGSTPVNFTVNNSMK